MKKIFREIHLWLPIPLGLIIALAYFSGAMLIFENEVNEWFRCDLYYVGTVKESPLLMDKLLGKVATTLPDNVSVTGVNISSDPGRAHQVGLSKPCRASLYIDQCTGEVKRKSERSGFFMFMSRMHRWLLNSMNPGNEGTFRDRMTVGISMLLLVFVPTSGIAVWWPCTRKALKNSLKVAATKGWGRFWCDLHVVNGVYTLIFLPVMVLTGLTWSSPWHRTAFCKVLGVEVQQRAVQGYEQKSDAQKRDTRLVAHREKKKEENEVRKGERSGHPENNHSDTCLVTSPFVYWQEVYSKLRCQNPEYKQISISFGTASVSFSRSGNQRASDRYSFNMGDDEFIETSLYQHQDKSRKIHGWIYSVYVGNQGGMLTRILIFVAALLGATLPLTGYYLWIRRLIKVRK